MELNDTVSKHFRKIDGKRDDEKFQIKNIDFIYLINLDRRPLRLEQSLAQLEPYQIRPHRVPGIDGWSLTQEVFDDIAMIVEPLMEYDQGVQISFQPGNFPSTPFANIAPGQRCLHSQAPGGGMGCTLTHLSILEDAYTSSFETIWIVEDDFTVNGNPHDLGDLICQLDENAGADGWDVLYTDDDDYYAPQNVRANSGSKYFLRPGFPMPERLIERKAVGENFFKIGGRTQTHSYLFRRSGMKKILESVKKNRLFFPIDTELSCIEGLNRYNLKFDLVHGKDRKYTDTYCCVR